MAHPSRPARSHLGFFLLSRIVLRARATHLPASPHKEQVGFAYKMLFPIPELTYDSLPLQFIL